MKRYIFLFAVVALASCQRVVHLNLETTSPQLVIQGNVPNAGGFPTVTMSSSVNFYEPNTWPPVSGASVVITDSTFGVKDTLTETSPGTYTAYGISGIPDHIYNLFVQYGGKIYTATSTMPDPVVLDSITFSTISFGNKTLIQPIPNFQDPPGVPNWYQFQLWSNDTLIQKSFVFDDQYSDGRYIHEPLQTDTGDVKQGANLTVAIYCIDKDVYNYFLELIQITDPNQQSQNAAPANPTSNINGGCLGYFSAHTVSILEKQVPNF
jgi:hypothetical protein